MRIYEYYRDAEHTKLLDSVKAQDLEIADRVIWNRHKVVPTDAYLFIRIPPDTTA